MFFAYISPKSFIFDEKFACDIAQTSFSEDEVYLAPPRMETGICRFLN